MIDLGQMSDILLSIRIIQLFIEKHQMPNYYEMLFQNTNHNFLDVKHERVNLRSDRIINFLAFPSVLSSFLISDLLLINRWKVNTPYIEVNFNGTL